MCCCVRETAWQVEHMCVALMGTADTCQFHLFSGALPKKRGLRTDFLGLCVCAGLYKINSGFYGIVLMANSFRSLLLS